MSLEVWQWEKLRPRIALARFLNLQSTKHFLSYSNTKLRGKGIYTAESSEYWCQSTSAWYRSRRNSHVAFTMEADNTSFLSRCRHLCFGTKGSSSRSTQSKATRYVVKYSVIRRLLTPSRHWPRISASCSVEVDLYEDDLSLLLEVHEQTHSMPQRRSIATTSGHRPRTQSLAVPQWCRLPSSSRFTVLLIAVFFLSSNAFAAPLQYDRLPVLVERQSVPDQSGNTGNSPVPANARPSQQAVDPPDAASASTRAVATVSSVLTAVRISATTAAAPTTTSISSPLVESTFPSGSTSPLGPFFTPRPTFSPPNSNPENQLQRVEPQNILSPASIAGIVLGGVILIILVILSIFLCRRRRKAREIREISIRRSKIGSRLANRVFGQHYDENIARSRSRKVKKPKYFDDSVVSWGNVRKEMIIEPTLPSIKVSNAPLSPSIYSPHRLTRATRMSTMTFGSVSGWLDKAAIGRPPPPVFTGTPSQLLDAPKPLFAKEQQVNTEASWKGDISPPRPARPGSAEPLGRLSGMGYGLGMR